MCKDLDDELREYDWWENDEEERREGKEQESEVRLELQQPLNSC
nr:hypothetical protein [Candidatus Njordarchaeota archaeon]